VAVAVAVAEEEEEHRTPLELALQRPLFPFLPPPAPRLRQPEAVLMLTH